jgi:hypothetical protein
MCGFIGAMMGVAFSTTVPSEAAARGLDYLTAWLREWVVPFGIGGLLLGTGPGLLAALVVRPFLPRK